jgi:hypothetical protein
MPGLSQPPEEAQAAGKAEELDGATLRVWLEQQSRCTSNARGDR